MKRVSLIALGFFFALTSRAAEMTEAERQAARAWVASSFEASGNEPFSFVYNGKGSAGFLASWRVSQSQQALDAQRVARAVRYRDMGSGLEVYVDTVEYLDFAAVEWVLRFKNTGTRDTGILQDIWPLDTRFGGTSASLPYVLRYADGSAQKISDFQPMQASIGPTDRKGLKPFGGRSSGGGTLTGSEPGTLPFFNIAYPGGDGVAAGIGWTGQWNAWFSRAAGSALRVNAGMERTHLRLRPGEEIRSPSILLLFWKGADSARGQTYLRRLLLAHYSPRAGGVLQVPPIAASPHARIGFEQTSETNMKEAIAKIWANGLPVDTWWIDAGWFSGGHLPWCDRTNLSAGDFNGDGRMDLICNSADGRHVIAFSKGDGTFAPSAWWPNAPGMSGPGWCDAAHLRQGDFNGDGKTDLICHAGDGRHLVAFSDGKGAFSSPGWWNANWCDPAHLQHGDFNGDGRTDLICDAGDGRHIVAFSDGDGTFSSPGWWNANWCDPARLGMGDFNGDGRTDLICHADDGRHIVAFSNGDGAFSSPGWWNVRWCDPTHRGEGDFNGDRRLDLICSSDDGKHNIAFSNGDGTFSSSAWWPSPPGAGGTGWCDPIHLRQGDFNGDGKIDLICDADDGKHIVAFSNGDGTFSSPGWWNSAWCDPARLGMGDFNGDGRTDLICHSDDGMHIVAFPNDDGSFRSPGWWWNDGPLANWATGVGNFRPDPSRFPNGLKPVADAVHSNELKFLLWFEPERVMPDTWMYNHHYDWLIPPPMGMPREVDYMRTDGYYLVNLGNPAARDLLRRTVSEMIAGTGIDVYRQDFNMYPLYYWRSLDAPDRQGMTEIQYVTGLYAFLDGLKQDHPSLVIDNCASGGRRIDFEMLRRSFVLTRSDYLWDPAGQQNHTYGLSQWIPISGIGAADNGTYCVRSGMGYHGVYALDYDSSDRAYWTQSRQALTRMAEVRDLFLGDFTPLSGTSNDDSSCVAWEFHRQDLGRGLVQAFRRGNCTMESMTLRLSGLLRSRQYRLEDQDGGAPWMVSGDELMDEGLVVPLQTVPAAKVITFTLQ